MSAFVNIAGQKFGRLTAVRVVERLRVPTGTVLIWECLCDCGNKTRVRRTALGVSVNSCGCLHIDTTRNTGRNNKGKRGLPFGVAAKNKLFDKYKRQAGLRGLSFELSMEQFEKLTQGECYYCGTPPYQTTKEKGSNGQYTYSGIDRVDNNEGYVFSNCVSCCGVCNKAKMIMTEDEFADWVVRVYYKFAAYKKFWNGVYVQFQGDGTSEWWHKKLEEKGISK